MTTLMKGFDPLQMLTSVDFHVMCGDVWDQVGVESLWYLDLALGLHQL